jgi:thioredoxin 1
MTIDYAASEPRREEVDRLEGATLLEFGSPWCGYCRRAQPLIAEALAERPGLRHIKIADASGRRLGRSFKVKLWPTLVFLSAGKEVARVVRPHDAAEIRAAMQKLDNSGSGS